MIEKLFNLLPADLTVPTAAIYTAIGAGFVLWAIGAKLSRSIFTLAMVAGGCAVGRRLPGYFNWQVDGMATAVGAAVVMGVLGYTFHRLWVAVLLGLTLTIWGALGVWILHGPSDPFTWPALADSTNPIGYLKDLWLSLPGNVVHLLPIVCGTLYISGLAFALLWHRAGAALLHSILGATLAIAAGLILLQTRYPQYLDRIPHRAWVQCAILAGVVLLGMWIQWRPVKKKAPATIEPVPAQD